MEQINNIEYKIKSLENLNLIELKTILYINKNLTEFNKNKINVLIKNIIINSFKIIKKEDDSDNKSESNSSNLNQQKIENKVKKRNINMKKNNYINNNSDDSYTIDSIMSDETDNIYEETKKVMFDKNNKKEKNQTLTHASEKLLSRMMSEAQYINNIGNYENSVSKPFSDEPLMNNTRELGKRKNIKK